MLSDRIVILQTAYRLFNERNIEELLHLMTPDVHWPNGWEGGYMHGWDEVRNYWLRQWSEINPHVEPQKFQQLEDGKIEVLVDQTVKDLHGALLLKEPVKHIYSFTKNLVSSMEIQKPE